MAGRNFRAVAALTYFKRWDTNGDYLNLQSIHRHVIQLMATSATEPRKDSSQYQKKPTAIFAGARKKHTEAFPL